MNRLAAIATVILLAALAALMPRVALGQETAPRAAVVKRADESQIAALIQQLGAEDFAVRERSQSELAQLGLEAFDALHAAQSHNDPEIQMRARYLVRSMSVRWFADSDPPEVVKLLRGYGDLPEGERRNRMESLAKLPDRQGTLALCRLARFETVDVLSKYAALRVMEQPDGDDPKAREHFARSIAAIVTSSNRSAARWLALYSRTLVDPGATLAEWDAVTRAEKTTSEMHPSDTNQDIVRDLYRWQVELLKRQGRDDEVAAVIRRMFELLSGTPDKLKDDVGWLIHTQRYSVVLELAERFEMTFDAQPELIYRLAEAQLKLGKTDEANATAERALASRADNPDEHLVVGERLQNLYGLLEWAEREFRQVMNAAPAGTVLNFRARFHLSELLHDQLKEQAAAEILQPVCDLMDKDPQAQETCKGARRNPDGVYSRMHNFYANALVEQQKFAEAETHLDNGAAKDPTDADLLIALYRLPQQTAERQAKTKALIDSAIVLFRKQLELFQKNAEAFPPGEVQESYNLAVAQECNQIAWLVGNTYGDFDEAVRLSHRSIELRPEFGGYLDTLGRCYYAKGDLANAIKYQSLAVKFDPHAGAIRRQLELFQKEQAARGAASRDGARQDPK